MGIIKTIKQSLAFPKNFIIGRLKTPAANNNPDNLKAGSGVIMEEDGSKVAVYKDEYGKVSKMSAVCPHLGCVVDWDGVSNSWACPCHGSKFKADGSVVQGPATSGLKRL